MRTLTARDIIRTWEWGWNKHPVDRALFILHLALPDQVWGSLAELSIGQRNDRLLSARAQVFGQELACFVNCPYCSAALEFTVSTQALRRERGASLTPPFELVADGVALRFRLPNSRDLAALAGLRTATDARETLLRRCLLEARQGDVDLETEVLRPEAVAALSERMIELDPAAELRFALNCTACGGAWSANLDIVGFFWSELAAQAKRLLHDVHILARAYGWSENDILAMSDIRRQLYLDLVRS
jgi:hypothetical protein